MQKQILILLGLIGVLTACLSQPEPAILEPQIVEISFNQITNSSLKASAKTISRGMQTQSFSTVPAVDYTLAPTSEGTFTYNGFRYLAATFRVALDVNANNYPNLSFVALNQLFNIDGTAIKSIKKYDGSSAASTLARQILPVHTMEFDGLNLGIKPQTESFQAWARTADALPTFPNPNPQNKNLLDYGFVTRNPSISGTFVTFAFRVPLQASRKDDPYSLTFLFAIYTDNSQSITESLEEQGANSAAMARATSSQGVTQLNVFPGSTLVSGNGITVRKLCQVRIARLQNAYLYPPISTGCVQ